ncbi:MAG TPA: sugar ABC transporter permease [Blastocatellia bacterium]|nr:sugar ABC transporter permease [Blastocatellia bacterium]
MTRGHRDAVAAYLFVLPAGLLLGIFVIYPICELCYVSLHEWNILDDRMTYVATANYSAIFADDGFWQAVVNTVTFTAVTVPVGMAISLALALLLDSRLKAFGILRTALFTPVVTSSVAAGIVFVWLLNDDRGLINGTLRWFGVDGPNWLQSETWAMPAVILMWLWKQAGYNMVLFLAGLQAIPSSTYEAAEIDGARPGWQTFRLITWPQLWPTTFFVLVVSVIFAFRAFDQMYVMTRGGPVGSTTTLVYYVFDKAFKFGDMGQAAAVSTLMLAMVMALTWMQFRFRHREE